MNERKQAIINIWKEESLKVLARMYDLEDKAQDSGMTEEEESEWKHTTQEYDDLLEKLLDDLEVFI